jgi:signal transduction histidine kinase
MKSEFLANVSHELRTPLTPIRGYADILKRKRFSKAKERSFLDAIEQSSERLERIVEILIDYAAIEGGRLAPGARPVAVRPLLQDVVARWRGRSDRHRFTLRVASGVPSAAADAKRLDRVMDELLDNAVKFSPAGGPISVSASRASNAFGRGRDGVRIDVRDRGIGIEPEKVQGLFLEFRQLDASETRTYGGLGLGLAYAQRVMTALGGRVSAKSTPGEGTTFTVLLPAAGSPRHRGAAPEGKRAR